MRRFARYIADAMLFGAVGTMTTLGVAWTGGFFIPGWHHQISRDLWSRPVGEWPAPVPASWPKKAVRFDHIVSCGYTYSSFVSCEADSPKNGRQMTIFAHGVPFRAVSWYYVNSDDEQRGSHFVWECAAGNGAMYCFGFRPMWAGLCVDVGSFGAVAWLVARGIPICKRRWCRSAGTCVACGYDIRSLGGSAQCPECGTLAGGAVGSV